MADPHEPDAPPPAPTLLDDDLAEDLRARVKAELAPGERLLWAGRGRLRAKPSAVKGPVGGVLLVLGLLGIGGLFLAGAFGAFGPPGPKDTPMLGVFGSAMIVGGLLFASHTGWAWAMARRPELAPGGALYALTDRRAIAWVPRAGSEAVEVHSVPRGKVTSVYRAEYPDGSGDVTFLLDEGMYWGFNSLQGVADVRRVEDLVRRTLLVPEATG